MKYRRLRLLLFVFAVIFLVACTKMGKTEETKMATYDTRTERFLKYAEKYDLIKSADYQDLEEQLIKENARRKKAVEQGEVIYGPMQYTMETYLKYICGSVEPELIERMKGKELSCTEEEVQAYYEEHKEYIAVQEAAMQFEVIMTSQKNKEMLKKIAEEDDVIKRAESNKKIFSISKIEFQENSVVYNRNPELMKQLFAMKTGERYLAEDGEGTVYLYVAIEKIEKSILPYEEIKESVENMYLRAKLDEILLQE